MQPQILVIDDEEILIDVIKDVLNLMNIPAVFAESGAAGIELFASHQESIRLILLDILMPGIGGVETYDKIHEMNPGIKVIFMSGFPADDALAIQKLPGTTEFLKKPFSVQEIMSVIQKML